MKLLAFLLEDDPPMAHQVTQLLAGCGYEVRHFRRGDRLVEAMMQKGAVPPDLLVLDWHVPGLSGLDVLVHVRVARQMTTPVMFLTSESDEQQVVQVLLAGADDYCSKPLRPMEFAARVMTQQRRSMAAQARTLEIGTQQVLATVPGYELNFTTREVLVHGQRLLLSEKEFSLAWVLFSNVNHPLSREQLLRQVWGRFDQMEDTTLTVHISWVRRKLQLDKPGSRVRLLVLRGFGYRLNYDEWMTAEAADADGEGVEGLA